MTHEERQLIRRLHAVILDYENEHAKEVPEDGCGCDLCKAALQTVLDTAVLLRPAGEVEQPWAPEPDVDLDPMHGMGAHEAWQDGWAKGNVAAKSGAGVVERLRERLTSEDVRLEAARALCPDEAHWEDFRERYEADASAALDAALHAAAFPPPSDSQGDQERCCGSCGGSGEVWTKRGKGAEPTSPCPDRNPAPTQVEGDDDRTEIEKSADYLRAGGFQLVADFLVYSARLKEPEQPEGGDEEDWKPLWILRPTPVADAENHLVWGPGGDPEVCPHPNQGEACRYLPATSQDSSGLEEERDKLYARVVEVETGLRHLGANLMADHVASLEELAAGADRKAAEAFGRRDAHDDPAKRMRFEAVASAHAAYATTCREKAAELKGERDEG